MSMSKQVAQPGVRLLSKLFLPTDKSAPSSASVKSIQLLHRAGLVRKTGTGFFSLLPIGRRILSKLEALIDEEMEKADCQRLWVPLLMSREVWDKTGRWESTGPELMKLKDRHDHDYVIGPTHEEAFTSIVADNVTTYKQLPQRLYQIDHKLRDEVRPRFGLMRAREFIMKDLYTFDRTREDAMKTYHEISEAYNNIFSRLTLPFVRVSADSGNIGGSLSHEYHCLSDVGEDVIVSCQKCKKTSNVELLATDSDPLPEHADIEYVRRQAESTGFCTQQGDGCSCEVEVHRGIEMGHVFVLGTKYSEPLGAKFYDENNKLQLCEMGCYGIGVSRLLSAIVEVYGDEQAATMVWPKEVAPFRAVVQPTKSLTSDKPDYVGVQQASTAAASAIASMDGFRGEVVLDDRSGGFGRRMKDIELVGFPFVVVAGDAAASEGQYEVQDRLNGTKSMMPLPDVLEFLKKQYTS